MSWYIEYLGSFTTIVGTTDADAKWIELHVPYTCWQAALNAGKDVPPLPNEDYGTTRMIPLTPAQRQSGHRQYPRTLTASLILARATLMEYGWAYPMVRLRCDSGATVVLASRVDS